MIDLHCHFLPGIDDGAATFEEAFALARAAVADGITHAVMTPHMHPGVFENRKSAITSHVARLRARLVEERIPLRILPGAEVRIGPELIDLLEQDEIPFIGTLGADRVMLLELPHGQVPVGSDRLVAWLRARGIRPLIAHPERNKDVMRNLDKIRPFVDAGCLLQVTAGSLTGAFGPQARQRAVEMLEEDWVFVLSTDAHNLEHRPPQLAAGRAVVERLGGPALAGALTEGNAARLLGLEGYQPAAAAHLSASPS